jgi:hypothetical protein
LTDAGWLVARGLICLLWLAVVVEHLMRWPPRE